MKARGMEPWPYQYRLANLLLAHKNIVVGKARQIGVTEELTDYARWMVEQGKRVLVISKGREEAEDFLARSGLEHSAGVIVANTRRVRLGNGGSIRALPATKNAGRSFTGDLVVVDEAAFHPWAAENFKAYRATMADVGQLVIVSTGNGKSGFFHDYYQGAKAGRNGFAHAFYGYFDRPDRTEATFAAEAAAYEGIPGGHSQENPRDEAEMFVSHSGLVYGMDPDDGVLIFDPDRNLSTPPWSWAESKFRIVGIDPGGVRDPYGIVAIGLNDRDQAYVFGCRRFRGAQSADAIANQLSIFEEKGKLSLVVVDRTNMTLVESLRQMGYNAHAASADKGARISTMKGWLKSGRLTMPPTFTDLIEEFHSYFKKDRADNVSGGNPWETTTVGNHHADLLDALGYAVLETQGGRLNASDPGPVRIERIATYRGQRETREEWRERKAR